MARTSQGTSGSGAPSVLGRPAKAPKPAPPPSRLRTRILPRSVLGMASLILAFAVGAGFSGVVLYSYYQYKLNQTNERVNSLVSGYKKQFANAEGDLAAAVAAAKANIQSQLKSIEQVQASPATLAALVKQSEPDGLLRAHPGRQRPSLGRDGLRGDVQPHAVAAADVVHDGPGRDRSPGTGGVHPPGQRRHAGDRAVLGPPIRPGPAGAPLPSLHVLPAAAPTPAPQPAIASLPCPVWVRPGRRSPRASVIDVSASGIAEDAAIGPAFQGGPLINQAGQVVAVASRSYAPLGFTTDGVWFAPYRRGRLQQSADMPGRHARRQSLIES